MAKYFRFPFANQGDKVTVPDTTQADGQVSYNQGYGPDYQRTPGTDPQARRIERNRFNQLLFDVTETLQEYYQESIPPYITAAENGGSNYPYSQYAKVRFNPGSGERVYESLLNNNTNLPTVTTAWRFADFTGLDARYGLGSTTPLRTGTGTGNIPLIGTPGTTAAGNNSAVIVRAGSNTNGNYVVYSNGLIKQWNTDTNFRTSGTKTLPISFSVVDYVVVGQNGISLSNAGNFAITTKTQNNFSWLNTGDVRPESGTVNWLAFGF